MKKLNSKILAAAIVFSMVLARGSNSQDLIKVVEESFDFGQVGIDYRIFHTFKIINTGIKVIKIDSVDVLCDCSSVLYDKTNLGAKDTLELKLKFDTRDFYGPVSRKLLVFLSLPEKKIVSLVYLAEVGQWRDGLKPDPFAIFMLPTHKQQSVKINNKFFESLNAAVITINDDFYTVDIVKNDVKKGEAIELVVKPKAELGKGTYFSNFTIKVTGDDKSSPSNLTFPVKIVRF
ncbi:MAG TPA: DUF1573 domain-containing protein [candidate division Zixibacteria bacterium]|nr:DUF1573 domain-containing protein [candidate division Zixibacteria bacterium]